MTARQHPATTLSAAVLPTLVAAALLIPALPVLAAPQAFSRSRPWTGPDGQALPFATREEVIDYLRTADVVEMRDLSGTRGRPHKVLLERDGVRAHAIFRTVDVEHHRAWSGADRAFRPHWRDWHGFEPAAYDVAQALGLDFVPPAIARRIRGEEGSLQLWVERTITVGEMIDAEARPPDGRVWNAQMALMHVFDFLVANDDRNNGNILVDDSWSLWWVDHTRAFQRYPDVDTPEHITHCDRAVWHALVRWDRETVTRTLGDHLLDVDIDRLHERRDALVAHLEGRIGELGERAVLFSLLPAPSPEPRP